MRARGTVQGPPAGPRTAEARAHARPICGVSKASLWPEKKPVPARSPRGTDQLTEETRADISHCFPVTHTHTATQPHSHTCTDVHTHLTGGRETEHDMCDRKQRFCYQTVEVKLIRSTAVTCYKI